jgi:hypothetical protein
MELTADMKLRELALKGLDGAVAPAVGQGPGQGSGKMSSSPRSTASKMAVRRTPGEALGIVLRGCWVSAARSAAC